MKKYFLKVLPVLLILLMFSSVGLISVSAASSYSNYKGTVKVVCGTYRKVFKANRIKSFSYTLNLALQKARVKAKPDKPARVTVSKGFYSLDRTVKVFSNTILDATGAYFRYKGNLLRNGFDSNASSGYGYDSAHNITIKGGEWEQLVDFNYSGNSSPAYSHSTFRFAHCTNITVKNASFKNNYNCHDIELAGVNNANIYNNYFFNNKSVNGIENDGGRESLQIDVCTADAMPYFPSYDKTSCMNINIHNNTFKNKFRAVGSHHAVTGATYNNISVHHNTMDNIAGIAVYAVYWTNSEIYSNDIINAGLGIDLRSMINGTAENFINMNDLTYQQSVQAVSDSVNYIYDNKIKIRSSKNIISRPCGIRVAGDCYKEDKADTGTKAGVYRIYNVYVGSDSDGNASPNTISGNLSAGIVMNYAFNCYANNNYINLKNSLQSPSIGIEIKGCENSEICLNTVINGLTDESKGIFLSKTSAEVYNSAVKIADNSIKDILYSGIYVQYAGSTLISDNSVEKCYNSALTITAAYDTDVSDNLLEANNYGAYIFGQADKTILSANLLKADVGLYADGAMNLTAFENQINGISYGALLNGVNKAEFRDNYISSKQYGLSIDSDCEEITAEDNTLNGINLPS